MNARAYGPERDAEMVALRFFILPRPSDLTWYGPVHGTARARIYALGAAHFAASLVKRTGLPVHGRGSCDAAVHVWRVAALVAVAVRLRKHVVRRQAQALRVARLPPALITSANATSTSPRCCALDSHHWRSAAPSSLLSSRIALRRWSA